MAEIQADTLSQPPQHARRRYVLYPHAHWYFLLGIVVTWVGFSTSYFAKLKQTDIYHHIHGATAGLWMATLVAEPLLYQYGYLKLHRKIGYIAVYTLVPLLVLGGLKMMQLMVIGQADYPPGAIYQLGWIDLTSLILFPVFVVLAVRNGRRLQLHARYMACTVLVLLPPAVTRVLFLIPWFDSFDKTLNGSYVINYIILLILLLDDKRSGKIRSPYVIAFVLFVFVQVSMNLVGGWNWWRHALDALGGR